MENKRSAHGSTSPGFIRGQSRLYRYISLALVFCVGIALSVSLFMTSRKIEDDHIKTEFEHSAKNRFSAFKNMVNDYLQEIEALEALFAASENVTRAEFHIFTKTLLSHYKRTQALEWMPRVPDSGRNAYETGVRREGFPDFQITERNEQGFMEKADRREEYFPISFIEPFKGNEAALGYDIASEPSRLATLRLARDTGQVTATPAIKLIQGNGDGYGVLILRPLYRKNAPRESIESRRTNVEGFVLGSFRVGDLLEEALSSFVTAGGIDIYVYDLSDHTNANLLYFHSSRARDMKVSPVQSASPAT